MSNKDQNKDQDQKNGNGRAPQVGALLRASRLRVGEDLRDVSDILCIRYLYLEAIEECRYGDLPGNTYAVGFIRSYAEHLGLDGDEVVRRYRVEQSGQKNATDLAFPTPVPDSGVPKGAIVFIGVLIALLVYGGWYVTTTDESILSDLISPVPDHLKHLVTNGDAPAGQSADAQTDAQPQATASTEQETTPAAMTETASSEIEKVVRETTAAAEQMASDAGAAAKRTTEAAAEAASSRVEAVGETVAESAAATVEKVEETAKEAVTATAEVVQSAVEPQNETASQPVSGTSESATATGSEVTPAEQAATQTETSAPAAPAVSDAPAPVVETRQATTEMVEQAATPQTDTSSNTPTLAPAEASPPTESMQKKVTPEVTAEDLNALVLRQATGVSEQALTPAPPETPSVTTSETAQTKGIVIRATSSSWVEIRNPENGDIVFTGLMNAGNIFNVPDTEGLTLDTGNAGALDISVDGTVVPKIGGVGAVRKNVALDADRLKAGTAVSR